MQLPLLERNAEVNFPASEKVHVRALDWRKAEHRGSLAPWNRSWSLIVGSDVGYDPDLTQPLLDTVVAQHDSSTAVYFAIADRQEDEEPNVQDFIEAANARFDCEIVH